MNEKFSDKLPAVTNDFRTVLRQFVRILAANYSSAIIACIYARSRFVSAPIPFRCTSTSFGCMAYACGLLDRNHRSNLSA